jgi:NTE family protein
MMEVMRASPLKNKMFYIVDVFPRQQEEIPTNMVEVWHRARDIIFMDKTDKNIEMLKISEKYLNLLKKMYDIVNSDDAKIDKDTREKLDELDSDYNSLTQKHGAAIIDVVRIGRKEKDSHYLFEDADFSKYRIEKLIGEGEKDAEFELKKVNNGVK